MRYVLLDGTGDYISTPDTAGISGRGDYSIIVAASMDDWTPAAASTLFAHFNATGNQRSWQLVVLGSGVLRQTHSTDGTAVTNSDSSTAPTLTNGTAYWILVTRASAAGTVKFYQATWPGSPWPPAIGDFTQIGTDVAGLTGTLKDSTSSLTVGTQGDGSTNPVAGKVYQALLYSGIYGGGSETLLASCIPLDAPGNTTTWVSSLTAETWTLNGNAALRGDLNLNRFPLQNRQVPVRSSSW